jgi:hypothetical protein|tara:strand:- start:3560 stop:3733 length:174 start_codon:yes stop_codon:yes gene_type:complete
MNTLKSKLPKIEINKNDYVKNDTSNQTVEKKKKKYLDNLLSKEFINNYFSKKSNIKN